MSPRRSARIAAKEISNTKSYKEDSESDDQITDTVSKITNKRRKKKEVIDKSTDITSKGKKSKKNASIEVIIDNETSNISQEFSAKTKETSNTKKDSSIENFNNELNIISNSKFVDKGKSKEIVHHSDGSTSVFEAIDTEWLQLNKYEQHPNTHSIHEDDVDENNSDNSDEWEEVDLSQYSNITSDLSDLQVSSIPNETIEIIFKAPKIEYKPKGITKIERAIRQNIHKTHLLTLLTHGIIRNQWCNDDLIKAIACSLIERDMLALFDQVLHSRGRFTLITALEELVRWWKSYFKITKPGIRSWDCHNVGNNGNNKIDESFYEYHPSIDSFRKSLQDGNGSCDTSVQLFVALLRSLGIPARLVFSLQVVTFKVTRVNDSSQKNTEKNTEKDTEKSKKKDVHDDNNVQRILGLGKFKMSHRVKNNDDKQKINPDDDYVPTVKKRPAVRSRRSQSTSNNIPTKLSSRYVFDPDSTPIFWCEVYYATQKKWICVDPIRARVNAPKSLEPPSTEKDNVMAYVVAYEEDGYLKDVTRRYATQWGARTRKLRIPGKDGQNWWDETLVYFARPCEREQDKIEDSSLHSMEISERIPTTISHFLNHPLYALERHLKKFEIIFPTTPIIGHIKGEPIYPRKNVKQLHTVETWLREGRQEGQQPVKYVKSRVFTLAKRRAANMADLFNQEPPESALYVPKNQFGNVNMFKPSMCPLGGVHIPINGIGKIAKKLGIDYGDAVVGFDFQARRCIPVVNGIVVPEEHSEILIEAWREHSESVAAANEAKRQKEVLARWRKLITRLQIRQRLQEAYGKEEILVEEDEDEENELYHGDTDEEKESSHSVDNFVTNFNNNDEESSSSENDLDETYTNNNSNNDNVATNLNDHDTERDSDVIMDTNDDNNSSYNDTEGGFIFEESEGDILTECTKFKEDNINMEEISNDYTHYDTQGGFLLE
ncbi:11974_t:CDS:10 [Dentiscutata erythropus]|uniref:11974_t:CDS:1 n=1 Tax=Dentiscutata erythropus TaxID=1348616 RepID=A0A9N9GMX5_9GLOM|nr:11974_t:CDS:10 [Dentiscutata erythropus]